MREGSRSPAGTRSCRMVKGRGWGLALRERRDSHHADSLTVRSSLCGGVDRSGGDGSDDDQAGGASATATVTGSSAPAADVGTVAAVAAVGEH
jgi:hypothetical protein